ncbi:FAD-dependent oxidoreductase [Clostridium carnis]
MEQKFDSIIIGFGKGGKTLAGFMANKGLKVALIEKSSLRYGGTCINVACIPTKSLENSSSQIKKRNLNSYSELDLEYKNAIAKKDKLTTALRKANFDKLNSNENITIFTGEASFEDKNTVKIIMEDSKEVKVINGDKIFINTGTVPFIPSIDGIKETKNIYTSETLMDLTVLPKKLVIVGAGFIGQEFASIYSGFGSKVTLLNNNKDILVGEDDDDVEEIVKLYNTKEIEIVNNVNINKFYNKGDKVVIETSENLKFEADAVLLSTGRMPNTSNLNLEAANVKVNNRGFIEVSDTLKTSVDNIWALGDVNGGMQFTYISLDDYRIIIDNLYNEKKRKVSDRKNIPTSIFIDPTFSRIGLNVAKAKKEGYNIIVAKMPVAAIPRAKQIGATDGFIKVIIDKETDKIIGASILSEGSSELINLIKVAMDMGADYRYLRDNIYTHPTMTEALNELFTPAFMKEV